MSRLNSMVAGSGGAAVAGGGACGADWTACVRIAPSKSPDTVNHADVLAVRIVPESLFIEFPGL